MDEYYVEILSDNGFFIFDLKIFNIAIVQTESRTNKLDFEVNGNYDKSSSLKHEGCPSKS